MTTMVWKIYGEAGHTQRMSYTESFEWDFSEAGKPRIIEVENADITGSHMYSRVKITRNTAEECQNELNGQINDGAFENIKIGKIVWVETFKM